MLVTDPLAAATTAPARLLRAPDAATLSPGARTDLVVLDDAFEVPRTCLGGQPVERGGG